jgi:hypothetical protein
VTAGLDMQSVVEKFFLECVRAIESGDMISRASSTDKEFSFQNWFADRLTTLQLNYDNPSRNAYPDFKLVDFPVGFEIKGLGFPGREANYDCNSQVPSGFCNGRKIYYVFGRYPAKTIDKQYPVFDLVMCDGDFLNADHSYVHKNKNIKGFGSYGDIMIRDRKMYVAPTPFALLNGVERQVTLITLDDFTPTSAIAEVGNFTRKETDKVIQGYSFNMINHELNSLSIDNPNMDTFHSFRVYRAASDSTLTVELR